MSVNKRGYMKPLVSVVMILLVFIACTPQFQKDMMDNQYFEKNILNDPNALYIGEWTGATGPALTAIKINESGNIKMCSSNDYFGNTNGKVFTEDNKLEMIFESGAQYELISIQSDYLIIKAYEQEYKYYSGKVPENCRELFDKFK